jgi:hypothetical protein
MFRAIISDCSGLSFLTYAGIMANRNSTKLANINASFISVEQLVPNELGCHPHYRYETINGDPISNGYLLFEDSSLTEPFISAYKKHCKSEAGY